jgi:hypothetical protein
MFDAYSVAVRLHLVDQFSAAMGSVIGHLNTSNTKASEFQTRLDKIGKWFAGGVATTAAGFGMAMVLKASTTEAIRYEQQLNKLKALNLDSKTQGDLLRVAFGLLGGSLVTMAGGSGLLSLAARGFLATGAAISSLNLAGLVSGLEALGVKILALIGPGSMLAVAGLVGAGVGTLVHTGIEGTSVDNAIGRGVAQIAAMFGSDEAREAIHITSGGELYKSWATQQPGYTPKFDEKPVDAVTLAAKKQTEASPINFVTSAPKVTTVDVAKADAAVPKPLAQQTTSAPSPKSLVQQAQALPTAQAIPKAEPKTQTVVQKAQAAPQPVVNVSNKLEQKPTVVQVQAADQPNAPRNTVTATLGPAPKGEGQGKSQAPATYVMIRQEQPIEVKTSINLDGRKIAEAVTQYQAKEAGKPLAGASGFDGSMFLSPVALR